MVEYFGEQLAGYTFIIPLNLYSHKVSSVDEIKDGDTIAIPERGCDTACDENVLCVHK